MWVYEGGRKWPAQSNNRPALAAPFSAWKSWRNEEEAVNACRLNVSHCAPEHGTCREHAGSLARRLFLVFQPIFERNPVIEF